MDFDPIKRNRYYDAPIEFPHTSRNHAEDLADFHVTSQRLQNGYLHVWGIAQGLEVAGAPGADQVTVSPGLAIDIDGHLIALSADGHADIGDNPPGNQHNEIDVPAVVPLAPNSGAKFYLTISFSEILRPAEGSGGRLEVVPWLRFQPVAGGGAYTNDGSAVILAIANIDASGNLIGLTAADGTLPYGRRVFSHSVGEVEIRDSDNVANEVQEVSAATISPHPGGGLDVEVAGAGDKVKLSRVGGGQFSELEVEANYLTVKDSGGNENLYFNSAASLLKLGSQSSPGDLTLKDEAGRDAVEINGSIAWLRCGAKDNEGDIEVRDQEDRQVLHFNGGTAWLKIGAEENEGDIEVLDGSERQVLHFDGGSAWLKIGAKDNEGDIEVLDSEGRQAFHFDGNHANLYIGTTENEGDIRIRNEKNVDSITLDGGSGDITALGTIRSDGNILGANPTRNVSYVSLFARDGDRYVTEEVDIGYETRFLAFTAVFGVDPLADHDRWDAWVTEVYRVDGERRYSWVWDGAHFGPHGDYRNVRTGVVRTTGRTVTFRARTMGNAEMFAIGVVIYE